MVKNKSLFKNILAIVISLVLTVIFAVLAGVPNYELIWALTIMIAFGVLVIAIEDLLRKLITARELITWQYFVGLTLILAGIVLYLWMANAEVWLKLFQRAGFFVGDCICAVFWFNACYGGSLMSAEEKESRIIDKAKQRINRMQDKEGTREKAVEILYNTLRYRLVGDTLDGDISFGSPLAVYNDTPMTYVELMTEEEKSDADVPKILDLKQIVQTYVDNLCQGFN